VEWVGWGHYNQKSQSQNGQEVNNKDGKFRVHGTVVLVVEVSKSLEPQMAPLIIWDTKSVDIQDIQKNQQKLAINSKTTGW
jgi:hypothetical protein